MHILLALQPSPRLLLHANELQFEFKGPTNSNINIMLQNSIMGGITRFYLRQPTPSYHVYPDLQIQISLILQVSPILKLHGFYRTVGMDSSNYIFINLTNS